MRQIAIFFAVCCMATALQATIFCNSYADEVGLGPGDQAYPMQLQRCPDGGYALLYIGVTEDFYVYMRPSVLKIDADGNYLWHHNLDEYYYYTLQSSMFHVGDDGVMTFVHGSDGLEPSHFVRLSPDGEVLAEQWYEEHIGCRGLFRLADGNFFVVGTNPTNMGQGSWFMHSAVIDSTGALQSFQTYDDSVAVWAICDAEMDREGDIVISTIMDTGYIIRKLDPLGEIIFETPSYASGNTSVPTITYADGLQKLLIANRDNSSPNPVAWVIAELTPANELVPFASIDGSDVLWSFDFQICNNEISLLCEDKYRRYTMTGIESLTVDFNHNCLNGNIDPYLTWELNTLVFEPEMQMSCFSQFKSYDLVIACMDWEGNVDVEDDALPSIASQSLSAYPNPFNPETTISFSLSQPSQVRLQIFNIKGQLVATLAGDHYATGKHEIAWDAADSASGVYLIYLATEADKTSRKLILLK